MSNFEIAEKHSNFVTKFAGLLIRICMSKYQQAIPICQLQKCIHKLRALKLNSISENGKLSTRCCTE